MLNIGRFIRFNRILKLNWANDKVLNAKTEQNDANVYLIFSRGMGVFTILFWWKKLRSSIIISCSSLHWWLCPHQWHAENSPIIAVGAPPLCLKVIPLVFFVESWHLKDLKITQKTIENSPEVPFSNLPSCFSRPLQVAKAPMLTSVQCSCRRPSLCDREPPETVVTHNDVGFDVTRLAQKNGDLGVWKTCLEPPWFYRKLVRFQDKIVGCFLV